jgi:uncharacterized membrane protein YgdD (TMEM256/DUF423 family)
MANKMCAKNTPYLNGKRYFCIVKKRKMDKKISTTGAVFGMLAIILGAFGAHALKKVLSLEELSTFETGVKYQMYHALFLLFIGLSSLSEKAKKTIYFLVVIGVIFFSGSIYLLATNGHFIPFDFKAIGFVTPIGGLLLIVAWGILLINLLKKKS